MSVVDSDPKDGAQSKSAADQSDPTDGAQSESAAEGTPSSDGSSDSSSESEPESQVGAQSKSAADQSDPKDGAQSEPAAEGTPSSDGSSDSSSESEPESQVESRPRSSPDTGASPTGQLPLVGQVFEESAQNVRLPDECTKFAEIPACDPSTMAKITDFLAKDMVEGGQASAAWSAVLTAAFPEFQGSPLSTMLASLVARTLRNRESHTKLLRKSIEFFAGRARLTYAHLERELQACTRWDMEYGSDHDVNTPLGLRNWLNDLSLADEEALIWLGTRCSSWLQMCVKGSRRCRRNGFMGDSSKDWVQEGNMQMQSSALIYFLAWLTRCAPVLEQPVQSMMPKTNIFAAVLTFTNAIRTQTWHGAFGGESCKPLQLWHVDPQYAGLRRGKPKETKTTLARQTVTKSGRKGYSGKRQEMKESQAYTLEFGRAVAAITYARFRTRQLQQQVQQQQ